MFIHEYGVPVNHLPVYLYRPFGPAHLDSSWFVNRPGRKQSSGPGSDWKILGFYLEQEPPHNSAPSYSSFLFLQNTKPMLGSKTDPFFLFK